MTQDIPQNVSDHDLLVKLDTKFDILSADMKSVTDDTKQRLIILGENKVEKDAYNEFIRSDNEFKRDHERRVRKLESWGLMAIGGLFMLDLIIGYYLLFHK